MVKGGNCWKKCIGMLTTSFPRLVVLFSMHCRCEFGENGCRNHNMKPPACKVKAENARFSPAAPANHDRLSSAFHEGCVVSDQNVLTAEAYRVLSSRRGTVSIKRLSRREKSVLLGKGRKTDSNRPSSASIKGIDDWQRLSVIRLHRRPLDGEQIIDGSAQGQIGHHGVISYPDSPHNVAIRADRETGSNLATKSSAPTCVAFILLVGLLIEL